MDEDHRAQEPPGASLPVHMQHAQDLEEADAPATHRIRLNISSFCLLVNNNMTNGLYLIADVANTWPLDPTPSTIIEAMTTIRSVTRRHSDGVKMRVQPRLRSYKA